MVHKRDDKKRKKLTLDVIDSLSDVFDWEVTEKEKNDRTYEKGSLRVKFTKVKDGYKIIMFRKNKVRNTDLYKNKNVALTMLGETLSFREW